MDEFYHYDCVIKEGVCPECGALVANFVNPSTRESAVWCADCNIVYDPFDGHFIRVLV